MKRRGNLHSSFFTCLFPVQVNFPMQWASVREQEPNGPQPSPSPLSLQALSAEPRPSVLPRAGLCRRRDSLRNVLCACRQPRGYALRVSFHEAFARRFLPRPSPRGPALGPRPPLGRPSAGGDAALAEGRAGRTWHPRPLPRRLPHLQRADVVPAAGVCSGFGANRRLC